MKGMLLPLPRSAYKRPTVSDILKARHRLPVCPPARLPLCPPPACLCMLLLRVQAVRAWPARGALLALHSNSCKGPLFLMLLNAGY